MKLHDQLLVVATLRIENVPDKALGYPTEIQAQLKSQDLSSYVHFCDLGMTGNAEMRH
jgi:hypothetical protein